MKFLYYFAFAGLGVVMSIMGYGVTSWQLYAVLALAGLAAATAG